MPELEEEITNHDLNITPDDEKYFLGKKKKNTLNGMWPLCINKVEAREFACTCIDQHGIVFICTLRELCTMNAHTECYL